MLQRCYMMWQWYEYDVTMDSLWCHYDVTMKSLWCHNDVIWCYNNNLSTQIKTNSSKVIKLSTHFFSCTDEPAQGLVAWVVGHRVVENDLTKQWRCWAQWCLVGQAHKNSHTITLTHKHLNHSPPKSSHTNTSYFFDRDGTELDRFTYDQISSSIKMPSVLISLPWVSKRSMFSQNFSSNAIPMVMHADLWMFLVVS